MSEYRIKIVERLEKVITVEAPSEAVALLVANNKWRDEKIVLTADDFAEVIFADVTGGENG